MEEIFRLFGMPRVWCAGLHPATGCLPKMGEAEKTEEALHMAKLVCCGQEFESEEALIQHQVKAHGQKRKPVGSCCGMDFSTEEALQEHMRTVHGR